MTGRDPASGSLLALADRCVSFARDQGWTLATAESCTGGRIADLLTDVPGASGAYLGGWVVYHNDRKVQDLGVDEAVLETVGAVSEAVAATLASGARARTGATFAVATTGIAGPDGGTEKKPVGTLWLGVAGPDGTVCRHHHATGPDREANKDRFTEAALEALLGAMEAQAGR